MALDLSKNCVSEWFEFMKVLCICFGTYKIEILEIIFYFCIRFGTYKIEILEIIFYFSLIFFRVTASKLFQNFVYTDKLSNVNKIFFAVILY